jgi:dipeptidyl aminopeptidase/acylaminoacyl peptidase
VVAGRRSIAFSAPDPADSARKNRDKRYGDLERDDDHGRSNLWIHTLGAERGKKLTKGSWAVGDFSWSPDGARIAFDHQTYDALAVDSTKDISVVSVGSGVLNDLVTWRGPDGHPVWSPDGSQIAFETTAESPDFYYANGMIATVPAFGGTPTVRTRDFDEDLGLIAWTPAGICSRRTSRRAPTSTGSGRCGRGHACGARGRLDRHGLGLTPDGAFMAYAAGDATHYPGCSPRAGRGGPVPAHGDQLKG